MKYLELHVAGDYRDAEPAIIYEKRSQAYVFARNAIKDPLNPNLGWVVSMIPQELGEWIRDRFSASAPGDAGPTA